MKTRKGSIDQVVCYMYQRSYYDNGPIRLEDECFIPSEKICFSDNKAYKSDKPNNKDDASIVSESHTILRKALLPKEWVNKLKDMLSSNNTVRLERSETEVFLGEQLFIDFFANEKEFEENYKKFGIFILPNYIMRYYDEEEKMDTNSKTANRILEVIHSLDEIEKKSLATCLEDRIIYFTKKRNERDRNYTREFPVTLSTGVAAIAASTVTGLMLESLPASIFAGGLMLFGKKKYDEYIKNQCKEYCNTIFDALDMKQKKYFPQHRVYSV